MTEGISDLDSGEAPQVLQVLLVEDSRSDYVLTRDLLEDVEAAQGQGFALEWADAYEKGLSALERGAHDVALVDYRLGGRDGLELLREVVARGCQVPIILLTGQGDHEIDLEAMRAGAVDYLVKGELEASGLERAIRYAVERRRARDALQRAHDELEERVSQRTADLAQLNQELREEIGRRAQTEAWLRRARDEAERARIEAEAASRAKNEFLSRTSHELRTPMNAVLGFGQLLEMDDLTPKQEESVAYILKSGRHLLALINEVLDIARIEEGRLDIAFEPVRVEDALSAACDMVRPQAAQRGVTIEGESGHACRRYVLADRQRLQQIFLNLLSNAVKYNRQGGHVHLWCEVPDKHDEEDKDGHLNRLRVCVRDSGQGIAPEKLGEMFTPFNRLGAERSKVEGVGLGLALCKSLAEAMGGCIGVESEVGRGSTFWVELPLAPSEPAAAGGLGEAFNGSAPGYSEETEVVLLYIEDGLPHLGLIQRMLLHRPGVRLLAAMQGRHGLELARQHRPHAVLLASRLPDIAAEEALRRLRYAPENAVGHSGPVVALAEDSERERLLRAGASGVLSRPLDAKELRQVLEEALKGVGAAGAAST